MEEELDVADSVGGGGSEFLGGSGGGCDDSCVQFVCVVDTV